MSVENQLAQAWQNIFDGSQQAIDWVSQVRPNVARLNNEQAFLGYPKQVNPF